MNNRSKMMLDEHDSSHNVPSDEILFISILKCSTRVWKFHYNHHKINESTDFSEDFSDFFLIKIITAQAESAKCNRVKEKLIKINLNAVCKSSNLKLNVRFLSAENIFTTKLKTFPGKKHFSVFSFL